MTWRYKFSFITFVLAFLVVAFRLFYWQVVRASYLSEIGRNQYGQEIKVFPERGEILTSDLFPIATNKVSYLLFANPKEVTNKEDVALRVAKILDTEYASVSVSLSLDKFWVPIKPGLNEEKKEAIENLKIPGLGFEENYERFYPEASLAASLLGFVGKDDEGKDKGYFGLEGYYNRLLSGKEGSAIQIHDALGKPVIARLKEEGGALEGSDLILSIDRSIQFLVEKKLSDAVEKYGAQGGMVGVIDPKTGKIIALSSFPTFDPKKYYEYSQDLYKNAFISDLYEPGSTFKPLVMSAALNERKVTPATRCPYCGGPISVGGYDLHTWNDKYYPNTTMTEVIQHSDNTGMIFVAQTLGLEKMLTYLDRFGIGRLTGIDLQGEVSPDIKPENSWYAADLATAGFGQGISVTPVELLTVFSAIANKGIMMKPQVVSQVRDNEGRTVNIEPEIMGKPISEASAKVMTEMLVNAVNKGEASYARLKDYRIAGKTGTASIPIQGKYDPTKTIASFVGFAPADDPKFVMLVIFNKPSAAIYGAETAAPVFFSIASDILSYYKIAPTQ
ncbi:MAG: Peptidoglycan glycosyltransferase [Candidatus Levybacteria bacterium GW2011_GWC2_40_7]|nr:MAG: Peptidoglycan glycosyltransferase [Candidatus Levybacteria bacterium GW2011_GWC2_40_7]